MVSKLYQVMNYFFIFKCVYVTGKACNQEFHGMPENFSQFYEMADSIRYFMKWLKFIGIS